MKGYRFSNFQSLLVGDSLFEQLLHLFKELLLRTSGNVSEALSWLTQLDRQYKFTNSEYGLGDFIQDLIDKGYIERGDEQNPNFQPSKKLEIALRKKALSDIFGDIKKANKGNHNTKYGGRGDEFTADLRPYSFGDKLESIALSESLKNAQINHGISEFKLTQDDLVVRETFYQSNMSTVLMIDISHSMILYGEDRITPAKKVAMALGEYIISRFPKDTLDILVFGNDAWKIELKDLPYLEVGPYHTNTVAGLELAMDMLRKRKNPNKQVFMITDGKPTCIKKGKKYYKNPYGLDKTIISRTLTLAKQFKKQHIPITTFMIASDPYLMEFVETFTRTNGGKALYAGLDNLGEFVMRDYKSNKKRR